MSYISPNKFCGLLDNLVGKFNKDRRVCCSSANDYAGQLTKDAQEFFSVIIRSDKDLGEGDILAILCDDTKNPEAKNTYTFIIFISQIIPYGAFPDIFTAVLICHETCHFAHYYELFLPLKGNKIAVFEEFKRKLIGLLDVRTGDVDDYHAFPFVTNREKITSTIDKLKKLSQKHFAGDNPTEIDYCGFFTHLLEHLKIGKNYG